MEVPGASLLCVPSSSIVTTPAMGHSVHPTPGLGPQNPNPGFGQPSSVFQKDGSHPSTGGRLTPQESQSSPRTFKKSFSEVLSNQKKNGALQIKSQTMHKGEPAVSFSKSEIEFLAQPYKFAMVGKFSRRFPEHKLINLALLKMGFKASFTVGALKPGFILINFTLEEDFNRLWLKLEWQIAGCSMRIFKWTTDFNYQAESSMAAVWVTFPDLPVHFFNKGALYSIANLIGKPVKVDEPTADRTRQSRARICVEIDLLKNYGSKVWIECGAGDWMEQNFFFENLPDYCRTCQRRGHNDENCRMNSKELKGKAVLENDGIIEEKINKISNRLQRQREKGSSSGLKSSLPETQVPKVVTMSSKEDLPRHSHTIAEKNLQKGQHGLAVEIGQFEKKKEIVRKVHKEEWRTFQTLGTISEDFLEETEEILNSKEKNSLDKTGPARAAELCDLLEKKKEAKTTGSEMQQKRKLPLLINLD